jgi:hypothetical protein
MDLGPEPVGEDPVLAEQLLPPPLAQFGRFERVRMEVPAIVGAHSTQDAGRQERTLGETDEPCEDGRQIEAIAPSCQYAVSRSLARYRRSPGKTD